MHGAASVESLIFPGSRSVLMPFSEAPQPHCLGCNQDFAAGFFFAFLENAPGNGVGVLRSRGPYFVALLFCVPRERMAAVRSLSSLRTHFAAGGTAFLGKLERISR